MGPPTQQIRKWRRSPDAMRNPLTGHSGGSDRTLPPSVRSSPERSKSSGIETGCVRWSMTGRRQGPVSTACFFFKRPDARSLPDRTHKRSVRSLLQQQFTSCELTGRWIAAFGVWCTFSSKSSKFLRAACSQSSPNLNKIQINTNWD